MLEVKFYDTADDSLLKFAVIISKSDNKWVFCKHKERNTLEVPGGHREHGESILDTAKRELYEETGAVVYTIEPVCIYSVIGKTRVNDIGEKCNYCIIININVNGRWSYNKIICHFYSSKKHYWILKNTIKKILLAILGLLQGTLGS